MRRCEADQVEEVRREDDGELCGFVSERDGTWLAHVLFGGVIGVHDHRDTAVHQVLEDGLASLAERWTLHSDGVADEVVCIVEADPTQVTVALGYYSLPGVPTTTISADELASGPRRLRR